MKVNVNNEIKELRAIGKNGIEWTNDLVIGNTYMPKFDENSYLILSQADYDWWAEYIEKSNSDLLEVERLNNQYDSDDVYRILNEELRGINDFEDHHNAYQSSFNRIAIEAHKSL